MNSQFVAKEFKVPKQFLELNRSEKTTTVFSSLSCRTSPSIAAKSSNQDPSLKLAPAHRMAEDGYQEDEKPKVKVGTTETKSHIKEEKDTAQNTPCKHTAGTMKIKPEPVSSNEQEVSCQAERKKVITSPQTAKRFASIFSQKQAVITENIKKEFKQPNGTITIIRANEINSSLNAKLKLEDNDSMNQASFSKQRIVAQTPNVSCSKLQVILHSAAKYQTLIGKEQVVQCAKASSQTCSPKSQVIIKSERNKTSLSKQQIKPTLEACCTKTQTLTQGSNIRSIGPTTPITTAPVCSLQLLSIISTSSSARTPTSPAAKLSPKPSIATTVKAPTTPASLSKSTVAIPLKAIVGRPLSSTITPIHLANLSSTTTTTSQTTKYIIDTLRPPTPQTPPIITKTTTSVIPPQATKYVTGTIGLPITKPQPLPPIGSPTISAITPQTQILKHVTGASSSQIATPGLISGSPVYSTFTPPPLKENESPRIPQSEPMFKAWIPPLDADPMSQTFLRMPFTYQSLQVQCNHDNRPHVKRPMNAFMVWAKKNRGSIAQRFPNASNAEISVRLGHIWNQLPSDEQKPYFEQANELKEKHKHENPNWVYQPRPGKKCKKTLFNQTGSKSQPTSPAVQRVMKGYERPPIHPRSAPSSPAVKRPLWPRKKPGLSEEELQSRIVEDLLEEEEIDSKERRDEAGTGNPTMDSYIDEWLSPCKRARRDGESDMCLMSDAMLPAVNADDEREILEEETRCDGRDFDKYIKQLKTGRNNFTKLENNISNLEEDDDG